MSLFRFIDKAIDFAHFTLLRIVIELLLFVLFIEYRTSSNGKLFIIADFIYKYFASSSRPKRGGLATLIHIFDCNCVYLDSFGEFNEFIYIETLNQSTILKANDIR